jgi:diguanylate cyclase (GGDEF)-like protein
MDVVRPRGPSRRRPGAAPPANRGLEAVLGSRVFTTAGAVLLGANVAFAVFLGLRGTPPQRGLWGFWLANATMLIPIAACFARALLGGRRRAGALWLGAATLCFAAGNAIFLRWTQFDLHPPVPSPADVAYLGVYPCVAAAMFGLLRRERATSAPGLWLDGSLGAAGAATALSVVLSPVLAARGGGSGAVVVSSAFSVADLLLIAMIVGVLAVRGLRGGSMWLWLGAGLAVFCAADVAYALRVASGTYVTGTLWSALWVIGITIAAAALWRPQRPALIESGRSTAMLAVPALATVTAVVALVISSIAQLPVAVVALATLTLGLAAARTFIAFGQVRRLSNAARQAVTDELTGLGNRRALFEHGAKRLDEAEPSDRVALMLIDLDDFKQVNDSLGHQAGDEVLREAARRLAARVRHPDLLVRLGGDEFALVLGLGPDQDVQACVERILDRVGRPVVVGGTRLRVEASAGVADGRNGDSSISELLRRADVAMYAAKAGGAGVALYDPQLDRINRTRLETIQDLDAAIVHGQFRLHYQPKIDLAAGTTIGAEALVRWQHPTRGLLHPDAFLPLVEQSGLMGAVTRQVLQAAVEQIAAWRAAGMTMNVAVNLSASDLLDEHLAERVLALLSEHAVPVGALELEITESVLMTDPERARELLERLKGHGLRIAVDDYGTGYCALAYLRDLPVDELKIDRSFIANMTGDPRSAAIVRSTIELAHALGLDVVAEGVEHEQALTTLAAFGCDFAQGYHFSRPLPAAAFAAWVGRGSSAAVSRGREPGHARGAVPRGAPSQADDGTRTHDLLHGTT